MSLLIRIRSTGEEFHFDLTIEEGYRISNVITEYPVEDGGAVNDHIQGHEVPFSVIAMLAASRGGITAIDEGKRFLRANSTETMDVTTEELGTVLNCGLNSASWQKNSSTDTVFTMEFQRIVTATSRDVTLPPRQSKEVTPSGEADLGEQATASTDDEPAKEEGDKSFLASLFGF